MIGLFDLGLTDFGSIDLIDWIDQLKTKIRNNTCHEHKFHCRFVELNQKSPVLTKITDLGAT